MSNYNALKSEINNNIYENQTQQITGTVLNTILNAMTASLGAGYQFAGVAYVGLNPSTPDQRVYYLAGEGVYTNFGGLQVPAGKLGILKWDSQWHLEYIDGLGGGGANLTGYITLASTDDLPEVGQPTLGYLIGTNLYLYVGEGGDTADGKYQNCGGFRGPEGAGITGIEQTVESHENGGRNTIHITLSNGQSYDVYVRNGKASAGLFPDATTLNAQRPSPSVGEYAFVGSGFPADIYVCNTAGTWTDSGEDYDGDNVDLTDYATKAEVSQLEAKVTDEFTVVGKNKLDMSASVDGKLISDDGSIVDNQYYHTLSNKIKVFSGKNLHCSAANDNWGTVYYHFYDENDNPVGERFAPTVSQDGVYYSFDIPYYSGADYVLINSTKTLNNTMPQVEFGTERTTYEAYTTYDRFSVIEGDIESLQEETESLQEETKSLQDLVTVVGKNKLDISASVDGKNIDENGAIIDNQYYHFLSNKIQVVSGKNLHCSAVYDNWGTVNYHYYAADDTPVGSRVTPTITSDNNVYSFDIPYYSGAAYVLISGSHNMASYSPQIEFGNERTEYEAYTRINRLDIFEEEIDGMSEAVEAIQTEVCQYSKQFVLEDVLKGVTIPADTTTALKRAIKRVWLTSQTAGNVEKVLDNPDDIESVVLATALRSSSARTVILKSGDTTVFSFYNTGTGSGREIVACNLASSFVSSWGLTGYPATIFVDIDWDELTVGTSYNSNMVFTLSELNRVEPTSVTLEDAADIISFSTLKGKKVVCFGDSLTEMYDLTNALHYSDYLALYTGATFVNVGVGGAQLRQRKSPTMTPAENSDAYAALDIINMVKAACNLQFDENYSYRDLCMTAAEWLRDNNNDDNTAQVQRIIDTDWSKVDAITILGGTNDWGASSNGSKLGTTGSSDIGTTLGAINEIIRLITTTYPNIKVYWFTPTVRWENWASHNDSDWGDVLQYGGNTLKEYSAAIQNEVVLNHIPVCDLYNTMGWTKYNCGTYWNDGVHPRLFAGTTALAKKILSFLIANRTF